MGIYNFGTRRFAFEFGSGAYGGWPLSLFFTRELKLLWHHGPGLLRMTHVANAVVQNFGRVYEAVQTNKGFASLRPLLEAVDLYGYTQQRLLAVVRNKTGGIRSTPVLEVFIDGVSRVNYGQSDISALAGIISLSVSNAHRIASPLCFKKASTIVI